MSMIWVGLGTAVIGAGSAYYSGEQAKDAAEANKMGDYVQSQLSKDTQKQLSEQGTALTTGEGLPAWLQPLTQYGSPELENVISRASSDITKQSTEAAAIQGTRTGRNIPMLNKSIADFSTNLRYQDLLNTNNNIMSLYGTGINTLEGVRNTEMGMDVSKMSGAQYVNNTNINASNLANQSNQQMISSIGGAMGSIYGAYSNPTVASTQTPTASTAYNTSFQPITLRGSASGTDVYANYGNY